MDKKADLKYVNFKDRISEIYQECYGEVRKLVLAYGEDNKIDTSKFYDNGKYLDMTFEEDFEPYHSTVGSIIYNADERAIILTSIETKDIIVLRKEGTDVNSMMEVYEYLIDALGI